MKKTGKLQEELSEDLERFQVRMEKYQTETFYESYHKAESLSELYAYYNYLHDNYPSSLLVASLGEETDQNYFDFFKSEFELLGCKSLSTFDLNAWDEYAFNEKHIKEQDVSLEGLLKLGFSEEDLYLYKNYSSFTIPELDSLKYHLRIMLTAKEESPELYDSGSLTSAESEEIRSFIALINSELSLKRKSEPIQTREFAAFISEVSTDAIRKLNIFLRSISRNLPRNEIPSPKEIKQALKNAFVYEKDLQEILKKHEFSFLYSNDQHIAIRVLSLDTNQSSVLSLENRKDSPAKKLSTSYLQDVQTTTYAKRQILSAELNLDLRLTEYCPYGNLLSQGQAHKEMADKYSSALPVFKKMLEAFKKIQEAEYQFSDIQNSDWLVDSKGHLKIADTTNTHHMSKPTASKTLFIAHAASLGRNLYQYLTGVDPSYFKEISNFKYLDFTYPIFSTNEGKLLKDLILNLIDPSKYEKHQFEEIFQRIADLPAKLSTVRNRKIPQEHIRAELSTLFKDEKAGEAEKFILFTTEPDESLLEKYLDLKKQLNEYAYNTKFPDKALQNFLISIAKREFNKADSLATLLPSLEIAANFINSPDSILVRRLIRRLDEEGKKETFSVGKQHKAKLLAKTLGEIPIENRNGAWSDPRVRKVVTESNFAGIKSRISANIKTKLHGIKDDEDIEKEERNLGNN